MVICENVYFLKVFIYLFIFSMHRRTYTDVGLAGFFLSLSCCVTRNTRTDISSRCVGATRIRTTDSGVETLIII